MTQVVKGEDCGNSPKNILLQEFTVALTRRDLTFLLDRVSDDVEWRIIGKEQMRGKAEIAAVIEGQ